MAITNTQPEFWLRGPIEGVHPSLMPAAHALLQTLEDAEQAVTGLSNEQLWLSPGGAASIGFHLIHLTGSTDRLLTYARGELLSDAQKAAFKAESNPSSADAPALLAEVRTTFTTALEQLRATAPASLHDARAIGRAALPTTVIGLLFHAAEHSQRHAGQIVTTARIVRSLT